MPANSAPPIILDKQLSGLDTGGAANYPVVHNSLPSRSPTNSIIHPPVATVQHSYSHVRRPRPDMDLKSRINPSIGRVLRTVLSSEVMCSMLRDNLYFTLSLSPLLFLQVVLFCGE